MPVRLAIRSEAFSVGILPVMTIETEVPSSLTIRLSTGKHHVLSGAVADEVYTKLKSNH
jgi:hypothetical protein